MSTVRERLESLEQKVAVAINEQKHIANEISEIKKVIKEHMTKEERDRLELFKKFDDIVKKYDTRISVLERFRTKATAVISLGIFLIPFIYDWVRIKFFGN